MRPEENIGYIPSHEGEGNEEPDKGERGWSMGPFPGDGGSE